MPCGCTIPIPDYPASAEWGPIVWRILHGLAEKAQQAALPADEIREWSRLIKSTSEMIPCDICRDHMTRYMRQHPLPEVHYSLLKTTVKTWFLNLHNEINEGNERPIFPYDGLYERYGKMDLQDLLWQLEPVMKRAVQTNGVGMLKYMSWVKSVKMMRAILQI